MGAVLDERREMIEEDDRLASDIETLEQLTGKVITGCSRTDS
jgi:hypothetical protein